MKSIFEFKILSNIKLNDEYFILNLLADKKLQPAKPGQFVQVLVENSASTFLRRPFSIHDVDYDKSTISLYIKIVGDGTRKLSILEPGCKLNIIYPLGNSFSIPHDKKVLIIGGGCGVAPLLFLAKTLSLSNNEITTILGGKCRKDIFEVSKFFHAGKMLFTTEDSSFGEKGFVTDHSLLSGLDFNFHKIYACGPGLMLRSIASFAKSMNVACEVSLENTMACGFGVCLCCITGTIHGNQCVCTDGPVFNINDLLW